MDPQIKTRIASNKLGAEIDNGHWCFDGAMAMDYEFGFVYAIRNLYSGRSYIGKKQYYSTGKVTFGFHTNWREYISSSKELAAEINSLGKDAFEFIVLDQYYSSGSLTFAEVWSIMHVEAMYYRDKWYNRQIDKVSWIVKETVTEKHRRRLHCVQNDLPIITIGV